MYRRTVSSGSKTPTSVTNSSEKHSNQLVSKKITTIKRQPSSPSTISDDDRGNRESRQKNVREGIRQIIKGSGGKVVSAKDYTKDKYSTLSKLATATSSSEVRTNQSIFEKIDVHTGRVSRLGVGTYSQLEDCIREHMVINRHRNYRSVSSPKYYSRSKSLTKASVLEDYSYDGILSPTSHHHYRSTYHHEPYLNRHKSAANLSLKEIRQINDALARQGISVFSHHEHQHSAVPGHPHSVGEIISACKLLIEDPTLAAYRQPTSAVRHVWDHIHQSQALPPTPPVMNYSSQPSTPGGGVLSQLFNPPSYQPPYNAPTIANVYNAPPPAPYPAPLPMPPPTGYSAPPPSGPPAAGRSVLASLFSGRS